METLKYKVITSRVQYDKYCNMLEGMVFGKSKNKEIQDEINLLTVLIEKWDTEHSTFRKLDPIELLKSLMKEHNLKAVDMANLLNLSEGQVSEMLHYTKSLSKKTIRILSEHFKMNQEAFNRTYPLRVRRAIRRNGNRHHVKELVHA